ncbi:MAG: hypothetical protein M1819_003906 [Sarea resinae]|nr:MAG: hypothetical protein M1819_003906 [Sarea resinae]
MARRQRAAAQAAAASLRTPTPHVPDPSDDDMADVPPSPTSTPREQEEVGTPAQNSEAPSEPSTPAPAQYPVLRRRRLGRPPKNKPPDWDLEDPINDGGSDVGTPQKRRRGRPPASGGRWKPKGGPSHVTQVPIDKEGNMMDVIDDEVALPEDPEGEEKVDKLGHFKGGREYRVRTFTILGRGDRLYMLSTEPARCIGFRDSYLFFQKHKQLYKIIIDEQAKRDLIDREIIPHSYKGRAIGVVTARSVFREFGARIVIGGRKVIDDYQVQAARASGEIEGELADPNDKLPGVGETYDRNRYVAWHGASSVYHSGAPSVPLTNGKISDGKKRKVVVTGVNWMFEHAREASRFNSALVAARRQNLDGLYDPHTNIMQFPAIMQPTHVRWEQIPPLTATHPAAAINDAGAEYGVAVDDGMALTNGTRAQYAFSDSQQQAETIFAPVAPIYTRSLMIADTYFKTPPLSGLGIPGPDRDEYDLGFKGLSDVSDEIANELPAECKKGFQRARNEELKWKESWRTEEEAGARGKIRAL